MPALPPPPVCFAVFPHALTFFARFRSFRLGSGLVGVCVVDLSLTMPWCAAELDHVVALPACLGMPRSLLDHLVAATAGSDTHSSARLVFLLSYARFVLAELHRCIGRVLLRTCRVGRAALVEAWPGMLSLTAELAMAYSCVAPSSCLLGAAVSNIAHGC